MLKCHSAQLKSLGRETCVGLRASLLDVITFTEGIVLLLVLFPSLSPAEGNKVLE